MNRRYYCYLNYHTDILPNSGTWALPGGHLELNESFETCTEREILEETNLKVQDIRFLTVTNDIMKDEGKHYITVVMGCKLCDVDAQPEVSFFPYSFSFFISHFKSHSRA